MREPGRPRRRAARRRSQAGFTLIELMVALVMFSFAVAGVLAVAVSMVQGYRETRGVIAAENAVRVPMDFIADALRQASPGVTSGNITDGASCTTSALSAVNSSSGPDQLDVIYAAGAVVTSTRGIYTGAAATVEFTDASQLAVGDHVVLTDLDQGHLIEITGISGNDVTLAATSCTMPSGGYVAGSIVVRARHAIFSIGSIDGVPTLMFDDDADGAGLEPLAEGVEDLQVALAIEDDTTGTIEDVGVAAGDDDWIFNVAGETMPIGGAARAVRVTMVARANATPGALTPYARPSAEDRAAGAADAFRRRVLKSTVELRNLEGSP